MKCFKVVDIVISLFIDLADRELTINCLDIITNLSKHIVLSEVAHGSELVDTLFHIAGTVQVGALPGICRDAID